MRRRVRNVALLRPDFQTFRLILQTLSLQQHAHRVQNELKKGSFISRASPVRTLAGTGCNRLYANGKARRGVRSNWGRRRLKKQ